MGRTRIAWGGFKNIKTLGRGTADLGHGCLWKCKCLAILSAEFSSEALPNRGTPSRDVETGNRVWSWHTVKFGDSIRGALKVRGLKTVGFPSNSDQFWMISVTTHIGLSENMVPKKKNRKWPYGNKRMETSRFSGTIRYQVFDSRPSAQINPGWRPPLAVPVALRATWAAVWAVPLALRATWAAVWEARAVYLRANREPRDIRVFSRNKLRASNTSGSKFKIQVPQILVYSII